MWVQQDYPLLENYLTTTEKYYGGKTANLDFVKETEKSRQTINNFIEEQTNNKIKDLIPQGVLNQIVRLVLTNAIYFKGSWDQEFKKSNTREQDFKITPTNIVKTPIMFMEPEETRFNYANLKKLEILELPYKNKEISMLVLLPKQGEEYDFEKREIITLDYAIKDIELSSQKIEEYKSQMKETSLDEIYLPKFKFETKYFMKETLSTLGMPTAFSNRADFSGISSAGQLFISKVIHQAYIKVDEKGTEAAAATGIVISTISAKIRKKIFKADHPFVFIIQEKETGNILFLGKVVDPSK